MRLERFDIELNNAEQAYFAGQEITGKIIIEASEPKKVNEILLELKGRARTHWTKHSGKSRKHCAHSEPYFLEQLNTLYTHKFVQEGTKDRILPSGHHEIPFSYTLPKSLPSSFEGEYGYIRYTCRAICERPWDFDIVSRCAFTVVGIEDINTDPRLSEPVTSSHSNQTVAFCCRASGSVQASLSIEKSGYTPGENIHASPKVENHSNKSRKATLKLVQNAIYKAKTFAGHEQVKTSKKTCSASTYRSIQYVVRRELGEVASSSTSDFGLVSIRIPSLPPRLGRCKIVSIAYALELEVEQTVTSSIDIVIGSIPFLSELLSHSQAKNNGSKARSPADENNIVQVTITDEDGETHPSDDTLTGELDALLSSRKRVRMPSSILSELYPSMPSPYYRESHFGKVDISDEKESVQYGDNQFAPKYPFYTD